uniref:Myb family transcription factor APL n=1 Tax=Anthurium amnicola TaxID=1678845 RepID=A0A1D1YPH3_9ARAE
MGDNQRLAVSPNSKPRLKWTRQLHEHFVEAVSRLGGAEKVTPKSVKRMMGIPGLTLYHLKSHLQKYRLAVRRNPEASCNYETDANCRTQESHSAHVDMDRSQVKNNESMLQLHVQMQRKLHEQIEVQKHLQLRIEAQGKYLQSVLRKAREAVAGHNFDSVNMEGSSAEISELVSAKDTDCLSSPFSGSSLVQPMHTDCSSDSCLTSWEKPERKDTAKLWKLEAGSSYCNLTEFSYEIGTEAGRPIEKPTIDLSEVGERRYRSTCGNNCDQGQLACGKRTSQQGENSCEVSEEIDLNR